MIALYRGNPEIDGVMIGYFDDVAKVQCAIHEDSRNHEAITYYYYLIPDEDETDDKRE